MVEAVTHLSMAVVHADENGRLLKGLAPTSPRVSFLSTSTSAGGSEASERSALICPNCPGPSVPHRCVFATAKQNLSRANTTIAQSRREVGKGQFGKGQGKGKGKRQVEEQLRTELQVFKGEVNAEYSARGILLGKGGENIKHISEESGLRILLEGDTMKTMRLVVVGPLPHSFALKMMKDLVEFVNEDYKEWVARRPTVVENQSLQRRPLQGRRECTKIEVDTSDLPADLSMRGRLLGKGGDHFKRISQITGSSLTLMGDEKSQNSSDSSLCIQVSGPSGQSHDDAVKMARELMDKARADLVRLAGRTEMQRALGQARREAEKEAARLQCEQMELQAEAKEKARLCRQLQKELRSSKQIPLMNDEMRGIAKQAQSSADPYLFWNALEERRKTVEAEMPQETMAAFKEAAHAANSAEQKILENVKARIMAQKTASQVFSMSTRRSQGPPSEGVTIERASASDLALMRKLWKERQGNGEVVAAWSVDNPLRAWNFFERRSELEQVLGRAPDELEGFHGSNPQNYLPIVQNGFRSDLRSGQVYGSGEYFAKSPSVSVGYCRGGEYMLVCRLCLGVKSSSPANRDGDHIWVPSANYYVISSPAQILPVFIIKFKNSATLRSPELEAALSAQFWSTKAQEKVLSLPPPRPCMMSRETATVLWMGLMYAHNSDEQLESDVRVFLGRHASDYTVDMKVQIVRGTFKKAHAVLSKPIPRDLVHQLNTFLFNENGVEHNICVEDAAGSPAQRCPKFIAKYCRGQNLRFTHPCWCSHPPRATDTAQYTLENINLNGAKGNEIASKFMASGPFHDGSPKIVAIKVIKNDTLSGLHEEYRRYLAEKHREEPKNRELYHGTNNNICETLYQHGLQPPSDTQASDSCPVSGGKGLCTTLCNNDCQHCTKKHEWNRCHMYGLGIYLADMAQKSHRYVSQHQKIGGRKRCRMIVCSVLGRAFKVEGHLKCANAMHDVPTVRSLSADEVDSMIEPCRKSFESDDKLTIQTPAEKCDMMFVQGLGSRVSPGFSVVNSEYIAYHPHQCLPKYEITYDI